MSPYFEYQRESDALTISLKDDWTFSNTKELDDALRNVQGNGARRITFQCGGLHSIDIAGAWVLFRKSKEFESLDQKCENFTLSEKQIGLFEPIEKAM